MIEKSQDNAEKMNVALVRGPIVFKDGAVNNEATPALAFAYMSAYLKKFGYRTKIVDAIGEGLNKFWPLEEYPTYNCQGLTHDEVVDAIPEDVGAIGISVMFSGEWPVNRAFIKKIRSRFPDALLIAGGEHISALPEYSLRECPELDVVARGEGEHTMVEILEAYGEHGSDFSRVNGVSYIDETGEYCHNGDTNPRIKNIDEIPWPDWPDGYLEKFWEAGKSYGIGTRRDMPFMISRGCPYRCTFCSNEFMYSTRYKIRDIDDIVAELKFYIEKHDITAVQLYDLTAIVKREWIVEFCTRILDEGIKLNWSFPSGTRSEALDEETLGLLKSIGCNYIVYAPESGSEETLVSTKKKIVLSKLTGSIVEAKKQGINVRTNLIIGFPGETWKNVFQTIRYGLKVAIKGADDVPLFIYSPYPGSAIFKKLVDDGNLTVNDEYFLSLTSLNSVFLSPEIAVSYNPEISARLMGVVRAVFILTNYAITYLFFPSRIVRTISNFRKGQSATVFEHRLKDLLTRKGIFSPKKGMERPV